ncbi:DUF3541 domain-containing protein [Candidatus Woesebacteria bacterium]|nr:DUF3541 domain-containing protein [Candidatus Woesebacteria bacterium]
MKTVFPYQQIKETYDSALITFSESYQVHFCVRLFRATGEVKYLEIIRSYIKKNIKTLIAQISQLETIKPEDIAITEPIRGTILRNPIEHKRILRRQAYYKIHPKLKFYFDSIATIHFLYEFRVYTEEYESEISRIIKQYQKFPWGECFIHRDHFLIHPVLYVNSMYQLHEMGMINSLLSLQQMVKADFSADHLEDDEMLFDQLYVYTHLIINESSFYQHLLTDKQSLDFEWILDFFIRYINEYKKQVNIDLLVEILACFFLCKKSSIIEAEILNYLQTFFDPSIGYLKKDSQSTLQDMEHANSIFLVYGLSSTNQH